TVEVIEGLLNHPSSDVFDQVVIAALFVNSTQIWENLKPALLRRQSRLKEPLIKAVKYYLEPGLWNDFKRGRLDTAHFHAIELLEEDSGPEYTELYRIL